MFDERDFYSDDPLTRHNAHQAAKGRAPLPDPDVVRKQHRENPDTAENTETEGTV